MRLKLAIEEAVKSGQELSVLKWWIQRYLPDMTPTSIVYACELAISHANVPVLEWLNRETQCRLPQLKSPVSCFDAAVVVWLRDHGDCHSCSLLTLNDARCPWNNDTFRSIKLCAIYEDDDTFFSIRGVDIAVMKAIHLQELETLQWFHGHRLNLSPRSIFISR